jgi:hypothetical protein
MKVFEYQFYKISVVHKYYYLFLILLFLQTWWLWQYRNHIVNDYAFVSQKISIAKGKIITVEINHGTHTSLANPNKESSNDIFTYQYTFDVNDVNYIQNETSQDVYRKENNVKFDLNNHYETYISYQLNTEKSNISEIKSSSEFYKEYFQFNKDINIEYVNENAKINRIKKFAEVKTTFDFIEKYFIYKIISFIALWLFLKYAESRPTEN